MFNNNKGSSWLSVMILGIFLLFCIAGWIKNVIGFAKCDFDVPIKTEVIRGIGVFVPPVGVVCGYLKLEDGKKVQ